jgi:RimJ/RimL family protein N-acetyltransferase
MTQPFLIGSKCTLRPLLESDIPTWHQWFNNPIITQHMEQGYYPNTLHKQQVFLSSLSQDNGSIQLAIIDKESDTLIGTVGLHQINTFNRNADISIVIGDPTFSGKGIGKEAVNLMIEHAFKTLNLHKVTAGMAATNSSSYNLFKSLGFQEEARQKEQLFLNGRYTDLIKLGKINSSHNTQ